MKGFKNSNGITLIALVLTIIILIILAGVTIQTTFGTDGLLNKVSVAKTEQAKTELLATLKETYIAIKLNNIKEDESSDLVEQIVNELLFKNKYNIQGNNILDKKGNIIDTKENLPKLITAISTDDSATLSHISVEDKDKLILRINVKIATSLKLTLGNETPVNVEFDDGTSGEVKYLGSSTPSVTKSFSPGKYIVKFSSTSSNPLGINYLNDLQVNIHHSFASIDIISWGKINSNKLILASVDKIYSPEPDLVYVIYDSAVFKEIPKDLFKNKLTNTNVSRFFRCPNITQIPEELFENFVNAKNFMMVFFRCRNIESIPENLFKYNVNATNFNNTFTETGITSIPENLFENNTKINDISFTFKNCLQLTHIPQNIINKVISIPKRSGTFSGCTSASNYHSLIPSLR